MSKKLMLHQFELGSWDNFIYFIGGASSGEVFVVDPGWHADKITEEAEKLNVKITGILCTHSHPDHVNEVETLLQTHDVPVYMLDKEIDFTTWRCENLKRVSAGDIVNAGGVEVKMVHTPGHTPGSVCFHAQDQLITGDTLFVNGCGRCDFVGGDPEIMHATLWDLVNKMSGNTLFYPGHNYGPSKTATMDSQLLANPFLKFDTVAGFVKHRMAGKTPNTDTSLLRK